MQFTTICCKNSPTFTLSVKAKTWIQAQILQSEMAGKLPSIVTGNRRITRIDVLKASQYDCIAAKPHRLEKESLARTEKFTWLVPNKNASNVIIIHGNAVIFVMETINDLNCPFCQSARREMKLYKGSHRTGMYDPITRNYFSDISHHINAKFLISTLFWCIYVRFYIRDLVCPLLTRC